MKQCPVCNCPANDNDEYCLRGDYRWYMPQNNTDNGGTPIDYDKNMEILKTMFGEK